MSEDGRYVVFLSESGKIVEGDTNRASIDIDCTGPGSDVFRYDRHLDRMERVSLRADGGQIEGCYSWKPSISGDGRFIVFTSTGMCIFPEDTHNNYGTDEDVFLFDAESRRTSWLSVSPEGEQGNRDSTYAKISSNGNVVAFESSALNLVRETKDWVPAEYGKDLYLRDLETGEIQLVTIGADGKPAGLDFDDGLGGLELSADGRLAAFIANTKRITHHGAPGVFVRDMEAGKTVMISLLPDGTAASGPFNGVSMSHDGRFVLYRSMNNSLVENDIYNGYDAFIHDRETGTTTIVPRDLGSGSVIDGPINKAVIDSSGRYVVFGAGNYTKLYRYDRVFGEIVELISVEGLDGYRDLDLQYHEAQIYPTKVTSDGNTILFGTSANGLVPEDENYLYDVYVLEVGDEPSAVEGWDRAW